MKKLLLVLITTVGLTSGLRADIITLWNFNSPTNDAVFTTGTQVPAIGVGTITNIGSGLLGSFGNPPGGGQTATSDTNTTDNSAYRMGTFPAQGTGNKTAGLQFFVSTLGFEGIQVVFDQENSATASKYWRVQYTTNGTTWTDHVVLESLGGTPGTAWIKARVVDFSTIAGVKNNSNFGVRYLSEWISSALGTGTDTYAGNAGGYSQAGTLWVDMVTVTGSILDTNNIDPTITAISNQTASANQTIGPIPITVGDVETPSASLNLTYTASNPSLFSSVTFGGSGSDRTITLVPTANQSGFSSVTVTVFDGGGKGASSIFSVAVVPPSVSVSNQTMRVNSARTNGISIARYASFLGPVTVSADAVDGTLLPPGSLVVSGSGSNRSLTITPAANEVGPAIITVTATDGSLTATATVFLNVVASNTVALWDFNSSLRDFNVQTGTTNSNIGNGLATALIAVGSFGSVASLASDLDGEDNSRLRLGDTFPVQNTSNKMAGVEFRFSTVGFQDIDFSWNQYNSATASRYWRVQYSTDGVSFNDALSFTNLLVTTAFPMNTSFTGLLGVDNNPNFAVRLVSEFESTVVAGSTNSYVGVTNTGNYSTAGTLWLDTIKATGSPFTGVTQATLSISRSGNNVLISWPDNSAGTLEETSTLPGTFNPVLQTPVQSGGKFTVTIPMSSTPQFFQLHQ